MNDQKKSLEERLGIDVDNVVLWDAASWLKNYVPPDKDWGGWMLDGLTLEYPAYGNGGTYPINIDRFAETDEMLEWRDRPATFAEIKSVATIGDDIDFELLQWLKPLVRHPIAETDLMKLTTRRHLRATERGEPLPPPRPIPQLDI